jgi:hypothetical protein
VVYALHLERIESQVNAERQVVATFMAAGAKGLTLPTFDAARADFDAALTAEPKVIDRDRQELLEALGVPA